MGRYGKKEKKNNGLMADRVISGEGRRRVGYFGRERLVGDENLGITGGPIMTYDRSKKWKESWTLGGRKRKRKSRVQNPPGEKENITSVCVRERERERIWGGDAFLGALVALARLRLMAKAA